jgi:hypothetical protein
MSSKNLRPFSRIFIIITLLLMLSWAQDILPPSNQTPPDTINNKGPGDITPAFIRTNNLEDQGNVGYDKGFAEGKRTGAISSQGQWYKIGCYTGCLFPCLGPSTAWILAHNFGNSPLTNPTGDSLYKSGYYKGYFNTTRDKKTNSVLMGGIMGTCFTAGLVAVYYLVVKDVIENLRNRLSEASN